MAQFTATELYADGVLLTKNLLDGPINSLETFINTTKVNADNIQALGVEQAKIAAASVSTAKITDANITGALVANGTIEQAKLAAAVAQGLCPPGIILPYTGVVAPAGWFVCDGSAVSRTIYADLFAVMSTSHGTGDGTTTFNLPDLRGRFIRGRDNGAARDPDATTRTASGTGGATGDNVGSLQEDDFDSHTHDIVIGNLGYLQSPAFAWAFSSPFSLNITGATGAETRPKNVAETYIIKI